MLRRIQGSYVAEMRDGDDLYTVVAFPDHVGAWTAEVFVNGMSMVRVFASKEGGGHGEVMRQVQDYITDEMVERNSDEFAGS